MLASKYGTVPDFFGTAPSQMKQKIDTTVGQENIDSNGREECKSQSKQTPLRSKLEQRIRKSQSAKKVEGEHAKAANPEEVKAAIAKIEGELGVVLHSKWAEKQADQTKDRLVSAIKVTQCLTNFCLSISKIK